MNNANSDFSGDLTKAIGEDTLHLENQWRVSLHQSVSADSRGSAYCHDTTSDDSAWSITQHREQYRACFCPIGVLLIVVPLLLIVFIVVSQRRQRQQMLVAQDAQRILDMAFGQPVGVPNQPVIPQPLWSDGTRFSYLRHYHLRYQS